MSHFPEEAEILGTLPIDVLFKGGYPKFHGDLRSITYRSCSENPNVYFEPSDNADFVSCYFTHAYYLLCKAFAKDPSKVSEFMIRTDKSIHSLFFNNGKLFTNTKGLSEEQFVGFLSGASSKGLMDVFKMNYGEKEMSSERRFSLASEFTKGVYKLMDDKTKRAVAKYIAEYEVGDDRDGCDYGFEKSVLSENREYLRSIWGFEEYAYPRKSILAKLSSSLYSKDEIMALRQKIIAMRGAFDGIFGVKFGTSVDVSKCENVSAFGFDFYRVPFIPEKKSKAFEYYDLWVTKITHKVFAIQGRSKSGITYGDTKVGERNVPPLVAALEKKYQNMSTDIGPGWKMEFPSEKCTLTVIGDVKGCANRTVSVSSVLAADVAGGIFGSSFGNAVLSNTFAENDKIRRSVKDYLMSEQDKKIGCTVVGESLELVALAAKESKIAVREKAREEALRKKIEADSAADAF